MEPQRHNSLRVKFVWLRLSFAVLEVAVAVVAIFNCCCMYYLFLSSLLGDDGIVEVSALVSEPSLVSGSIKTHDRCNLVTLERIPGKRVEPSRREAESGLVSGIIRTESPYSCITRTSL